MTAALALEPPVYRRALDVIAGASKALLPPKRIGLAEHAAKYRMVSTGGHAGSYSFDLTPYMRGPHEAVDSALYRAVAIVGPGQSGKTTLPENWLLKMVDADPGNTLWYLANEKQVQSYVKRVIDEMVRSHTKLFSRLGRGPTDNSLAFKRFERMWVEFLEASKANLINKTAGRIVADEIDAWKKELGDPYTLIKIRMQSFARAMAVVLSHPDLCESLDEKHWVAGIMKLYRDSTRCAWWWPCLHCGDYSSPNPGQARHMALVYDDTLEDLDDVARSAHLSCPSCGAVIEDRERREMSANGAWVGMGQSIENDGRVVGPLRESDIGGFWIVGAMSPFVTGGLGGLVRARVEAERVRDVSGDGRGYKEVMSKMWSFPAPKSANDNHTPLEEKELKDRAEAFEVGVVPPGVRYLTAAIDVQKASFEVLIEGRGVNAREVWTIDRFSIPLSKRQDENGNNLPVEPHVYDKDWRILITDVILRRYPLADDSGREMEIRLTTCDSGGVDGVTQRAYDFWRWLRKRGLHRRLLLVRGDGRLSVPLTRISYPDSERKDRKAGARGEIPVCFINVNQAKDTLSGDLRTKESGVNFHHHPVALPSTFWPEVCSEERNGKNGSWSRRIAGQKNESWVLKVYSRAAVIRCGGEAINWERPPLWAEEWEKNCLVHLQRDDAEATEALVLGARSDKPRSLGRALAEAFKT